MQKETFRVLRSFFTCKAKLESIGKLSEKLLFASSLLVGATLLETLSLSAKPLATRYFHSWLLLFKIQVLILVPFNDSRNFLSANNSILACRVSCRKSAGSVPKGVQLSADLLEEAQQTCDESVVCVLQGCSGLRACKAGIAHLPILAYTL